MARLEIEIAGVNDDLKRALREAKVELNNFASSIGGLKPNDKLTPSINESKAALAAARVEAANYRTESARLSAELKALSLSNAQSRSTTDAAAGSYREAQRELTALGKSIREAKGGFDSSLPSVQAQIKQYNELNNRLKDFDSQLGINTRRVGAYGNAVRGAGGISMEFNRIIQDAPFGMLGIGNNITQLTDNYKSYATSVRAAAAEQGKQVASSTILKGALASIISPVNLLTLGISLAVSGYTAYTMWAQKSAKATRESKKATQEYAETLEAVSRVQLQGIKNAQSDLTNLRLLYSAYQNANLPLKERKAAYDQIQQQYPEYFKNIKFEQTASEDTRKAYDQLTTSIIATSRARAAANLITKNSERQLENETKIAQIRIDQQKAALKLAKEEANLRKNGSVITSGGTAAGTGDANARQTRVVQARNELLKLDRQILDLATDSQILAKDNLRLEKATTAEIAKGAKILEGGTGGGKPPKTKTIRNTADNIVNRSDNSADLIGLEGVDREVEQVRQKYAKMYDDLSANAKKSVAARKTYEQDFAKIQANEAREFNSLILGEQERVASEIQRINDTAGIKAAESIQKELAAIDVRYAKEVEKAQGNADILTAIETAKQTEIQAVYDKYSAKRIAAEQKVLDKINELSDKGYTENTRRTAKGDAQIDKQLNERLAKYRRYFDELRKMNANNPIANMALGVAQNVVIETETNKANNAKRPTTDLADLFNRDMSNAVNRFGEEFIGVLRNVSRQAGQSFGSALSQLGVSAFDAISSTLSDVFLNQFKTQFSDAIKGASAELSTGLKGAIAGAGLLGGAISGLTKKTSTAGQGIGGALSGAATGAGAAIAAGAALGTAAGPLGIAIGAGIGGLLGLAKGIFGASKARKQEALERAQLEEQKKQTALMERQNALAYASQIIGRQTTQGVVTGIEVNEFGDLITYVAGDKLAILLDRSGKNKRRGV